MCSTIAFYLDTLGHSNSMIVKFAVWRHNMGQSSMSFDVIELTEACKQ